VKELLQANKPVRDAEWSAKEVECILEKLPLVGVASCGCWWGSLVEGLARPAGGGRRGCQAAAATARLAPSARPPASLTTTTRPRPSCCPFSLHSQSRRAN
jgi:hypothetical protein